jgi:phage terminase large subunit-like protein
MSLAPSPTLPAKANPRRSKGQLDYTVLRAMDHPQLFGRWFKGESWDPWRVFLAALFGLPMSPEPAAFYQQCTGRSKPPETASTEAWVIAGRRAGKSAILAFIACYLACFRDYAPYLQIGERATIRIMSADRDQARVIFRYLTGFMSEIPLLAKLVAKQTSEQIELINSVSIEIGTASFRSARL